MSRKISGSNKLLNFTNLLKNCGIIAVMSQSLPNYQQADIDLAKFVDYSMNPTHPRNQGKWLAFETVGYRLHEQSTRLEAAQAVVQQLINQLPQAQVTVGNTTPYGVRYRVRCPITGPNGQVGTLVTIWQIAPNSNIPRLITNWLEIHYDPN